MIRGSCSPMKHVYMGVRELRLVEAIVLSMTPHERNTPHVIDGKRRLRIARGSGTTVQQVNRLSDARKQMEKMMKGMSKGKMPQLPGLTPEAGNRAPTRPVPRKAKKKKKKQKRCENRRR